MKKYKPILILIICSLIPLLFTAIIPYVLPTELHLGSLKRHDHSWTGEIKLYVITLEVGSQYTIDVDIDSFWGMDVSLRIGETPYMIEGFSVDSGSNTGEVMHFTASKTGDYYIQMKVNSGGGFFDISVTSGTVGSATGSNVEFFDVSYLLVLILPSVFILAIGLIILKKRASRPERKPFISVYGRADKPEKEDLVEKEEVMICEYCGREIKKFLKKCPHCNTTLN
jgi:hypothetical protein